MSRDTKTAQLGKLKSRCRAAVKEVLSCLDRQTLEYVLSAPTDLGAMMRAVAEYVVLIDATQKRAPASKSRKQRLVARKQK